MDREYLDLLGRYFRLVGDQIEECTLEQWAEFYEGEGRFIEYTETMAYNVSTVFLAIYHPGGTIFETMLFARQPRVGDNGEFEYPSLFTLRYKTLAEARNAHAKIVQLLEKLKGCRESQIRTALEELAQWHL